MEHTGKRFWDIGKSYLIRAEKYYVVGRLVGFNDEELIFEDASWIPYTGMFSRSLKSGILDEVEPFPDGTMVLTMKRTIHDASNWNHDLPRKQLVNGKECDPVPKP